MPPTILASKFDVSEGLLSTIDTQCSKLNIHRKYMYPSVLYKPSPQYDRDKKMRQSQVRPWFQRD